MTYKISRHLFNVIYRSYKKNSKALFFYANEKKNVVIYFYRRSHHKFTLVSEKKKTRTIVIYRVINTFFDFNLSKHTFHRFSLRIVLSSRRKSINVKYQMLDFTFWISRLHTAHPWYVGFFFYSVIDYERTARGDGGEGTEIQW